MRLTSNSATSGSGLSMHRDKLYGGVTKGEVLALTRFRGSEGAPERSFGWRSLGQGCSGRG